MFCNYHLLDLILKEAFHKTPETVAAWVDTGAFYLALATCDTTVDHG